MARLATTCRCAVRKALRPNGKGKSKSKGAWGFDHAALPAVAAPMAPLAAGAVMRLADGMHHHVAVGADGGAVLRWTSGEIPLGEPEQAWLDTLTDGASAEGLGEGALEFMQRLHRNGLLEAV